VRSRHDARGRSEVRAQRPGERAEDVRPGQGHGRRHGLARDGGRLQVGRQDGVLALRLFKLSFFRRRPELLGEVEGDDEAGVELDGAAELQDDV
jgi:hypothetical protein